MKRGKEKENDNVHTDGEGKLNRRKWREGRLAAKEHRERRGGRRDANFANWGEYLLPYLITNLLIGVSISNGARRGRTVESLGLISSSFFPSFPSNTKRKDCLNLPTNVWSAFSAFDGTWSKVTQG